MCELEIEFRDGGDLPHDAVIALYRECGWSSAEKPDQLLTALANSHTVISAWHTGTFVGLGNAISDGALVVYYSHLLVRPTFQRRGIGKRIIEALQTRYAGFHQQILLAVPEAIEFYRKCGFQNARSVEPMWIYDDSDLVSPPQSQ